MLRRRHSKMRSMPGKRGSKNWDVSFGEIETRKAQHRNWKPRVFSGESLTQATFCLSLLGASRPCEPELLVGCAGAEVRKLGEQLGVRNEMMPTWMSFSYFLVQWVLKGTDDFRPSETVSGNWLGTLADLTESEAVYFSDRLGSLEPAHARRELWSAALYRRLCLWGSAGEASFPARVLQVWAHLVSCCFYVGDPSFVDEILLEPHPLERCSVLETLQQFLCGTLDSYSSALLDRLQLYALTRQSARRWFAWGDGSRMQCRDAERVAAFSRSFDSLIHVHKTTCGWERAAGRFAKYFGQLVTVLQAADVPSTELRKCIRKVMRSLLSFELVGRPRLFNSAKFKDAIHCYWSKFLFACCGLILRTFCPAPDARLAEFDLKFSFIGPAPRIFLATVQGDPRNQTYHRQCLADLRTIRVWVQQTFQVQHTLYAIQVVFCSWQRYLVAREKPCFPHAPAPTPSKCLLATLAAAEDREIQHRLRILNFIDSVKATWSVPW